MKHWSGKRMSESASSTRLVLAMRVCTGKLKRSSWLMNRQAAFSIILPMDIRVAGPPIYRTGRINGQYYSPCDEPPRSKACALECCDLLPLNLRLLFQRYEDRLAASCE